MSSSRGSSGPEGPRERHIEDQRDPAAPVAEPPAPLPPAEVPSGATIRHNAHDAHAHDVHPGTEEQRGQLLQWRKPGDRLAALGLPRLAVASRAAAGGGAGVGTQQESARMFERHILTLDACGWRVVGFRPSVDGDEPALWRVTIERCDEGASMSATDVDPEVALEELVRYTQADAR